MAVYPESYYHNPLNAMADCEKRERWEEMKRERKAYRDEVGCRGCSRYMAELETCSEGQTPHNGGFCRWCWDGRTGKPAPEIK